MAWTQEQINAAYLKVQQMAATDEEFRNELVKNPAKSIEKVTGYEVPDDFRIKIIENDPEYAATFVLPAMVSEELLDADLDNIAGGSCGFEAVACAAQSNK